MPPPCRELFSRSARSLARGVDHFVVLVLIAQARFRCVGIGGPCQVTLDPVPDPDQLAPAITLSRNRMTEVPSQEAAPVASAEKRITSRDLVPSGLNRMSNTARTSLPR